MLKTIPKVVVVDEASMLSLKLAAELLGALAAMGSSVVFVGDPNQLPSIDPGTVFRDLLDAHLLPTVELTQARRNPGPIAQGAAAIIEGRLPYYDGDVCRHVEVPTFHMEGAACDILLEDMQAHFPPGLVSAKALADELSAKPLAGEPAAATSESGRNARSSPPPRTPEREEAAMVAPAMKLPAVIARTKIAVRILNREMQACYNPPAADGSGAAEIVAKFSGDEDPTTVRLYDRVMNLKNVPAMEAKETKDYVVDKRMSTVRAFEGPIRPANGDCGYVTHIDKANELVRVLFDCGCTMTYSADGKLRPFDTLRLAYAITIHKSQGSQYDTVYALLTNKCRLRDRSLFLTAWSRAVRRVVTFGDRESLDEETRITDMTTGRVGRLLQRLMAARARGRGEEASEDGELGSGHNSDCGDEEE